MRQAAVPPPTVEVRDQRPPDIQLMRSSARRLLAEDADPPTLDELDTLTRTLRGQVELMIPEVEHVAAQLPKDDVPRYCALACVGEARMKLGVTPRPGLSSGIAYARRLSRALNALCDHYENIGGENR